MSSLEWQTDTYFQYIYDRLDNFVNSSMMTSISSGYTPNKDCYAIASFAVASWSGTSGCEGYIKDETTNTIIVNSFAGTSNVIMIGQTYGNSGVTSAIALIKFKANHTYTWSCYYNTDNGTLGGGIIRVALLE